MKKPYKNKPSFDMNNPEKLDLRENLTIYFKNWKWFLLSVSIFIGLAYVYLRYTTPEYAAYAKIILVDDKNASSPASALLKDLQSISEKDNKAVKDEIEVMKSRSLMSNVVKELGINIQFFVKGRIHDTELFPKQPLKINFIASDSIIYDSKFSFYLKILSETNFEYKVKEEDIPKKILFGASIPTPIEGLVITPELNQFKRYIGKDIFVKISPVSKIAERYKAKIKMLPADKFSKVISITLNDPVKEKARQIIDQLIIEYNESSINEKNQESKNTADFINERINLIATDLSNVDKSAERFKTGNRLTDITSEADIYLSSGSANDEELARSRTELNLINYMRNYINDQPASGYQSIPSNVGLTDGSISNIIVRYNELVLRRQQLLKSSSERNPIVVNIDQQLNSYKQSLKQSLNNLRTTLSIRVNNLQQQSARINSKISSVPGQERQLRDIERQQDVKESLYLYLLEKREEATISLTATSPSAKIIDNAYGKGSGPVSPNRSIIMIAFLVIGLGIPFSIIYLYDLLDNKIHNKKHLEKEVRNIPILGEIPKFKGKNTLITRNDRSALAESFRIIRTSFNYLQRVRGVKEYNNVIFVTSTIKGEGKTSFSMNMALTFANSLKKVLIIGADIRNPRIHTLLKEQKQRGAKKQGFTDYLYESYLEAKDVIETFEINKNKVDILFPGKIPPNPAELLMSSKMKTLFDEVSSNYDVVIVDTAPSMLVTDTLLFSQYAGHTFYLVRADYTKKPLLNFSKELYQDEKLPGMMMVVNGVKESNFSYGSKYGYGYGNQTKSKFSRFIGG